MMRVMVLMILGTIFMIGCSQSTQTFTRFEEKGVLREVDMRINTNYKRVSNKDHSFVASAIDPEFPVPKSAQKTNHQSNNPNIEYVRYSYQGLMNLNQRNQYFSEIKKWGWVELKHEQMGAMHIFQKGKKRIHLTVHQDFFTIFFPH